MPITPFNISDLLPSYSSSFIYQRSNNKKVIGECSSLKTLVDPFPILLIAQAERLTNWTSIFRKWKTCWRKWFCWYRFYHHVIEMALFWTHFDANPPWCITDCIAMINVRLYFNYNFREISFCFKKICFLKNVLTSLRSQRWIAFNRF